MPFNTLSLLILIAFLLLLTFVLALWSGLTVHKQAAPDPEALMLERPPEPAPRQVSNDEMRGARAKVAKRPLEPRLDLADDDAFDSFSKAKQDDLNFG